MKGFRAALVLSVLLLSEFACGGEGSGAGELRSDSLRERGVIYLDPREWEGFDVTDDSPAGKVSTTDPLCDLCWRYDELTEVRNGTVYVDGQAYETASADRRPLLRVLLLGRFDRWASVQQGLSREELDRLRRQLQQLLDRSDRRLSPS